jgi:hypothetical protein
MFRVTLNSGDARGPLMSGHRSAAALYMVYLFANASLSRGIAPLPLSVVPDFFGKYFLRRAGGQAKSKRDIICITYFTYLKIAP